MNIIIDRVEILFDLVKTDYLPQNLGLTVFVIENEWNQLPEVHKMFLSIYIQIGIIKFVNEDEILASQICRLKQRFGNGIALNNYLILQSCIKNKFLLVSSDNTIAEIARILRIPLQKPEALKVDLLMESSFRDNIKEGREVRILKNLYNKK